MIAMRPRDERGRTRISWLDSRHSFSFGDYFDPQNMGFRSLRVINEDVVAPGGGFGTHGHRDMEILSYVLEGGLRHQDSSGGGGVIRPGEIQFMRAGRGVTHSEHNASSTEPVHFLQIWIVPDQAGLDPTYGQNTFDAQEAAHGFELLASRDGREGSLRLQQDADLLVAHLAPGESRDRAIAAGRHVWLQVARGELSLDGQRLRAGDGAALTREPGVSLRAQGDEGAEVLLFDLA
ncbi:MAG TPA: pirin family protein [Vicinamibacteria bacterium]